VHEKNLAISLQQQHQQRQAEARMKLFPFITDKVRFLLTSLIIGRLLDEARNCEAHDMFEEKHEKFVRFLFFSQTRAFFPLNFPLFCCTPQNRSQKSHYPLIILRARASPPFTL
jgi:hypothetical protein